MLFQLENGELPLVLSLNALSEVICKVLTHRVSTESPFEPPFEFLICISSFLLAIILKSQCTSRKCFNCLPADMMAKLPQSPPSLDKLCCERKVNKDLE